MSTESAPPSAADLAALVERFADQPVAMLVDLVSDHFVRGTPRRISREAPVLILRHDGEDWMPGGGANAVAGVAALGGRPLPVGLVGDDESGRRLLASLAERGVDTRGIAVRAGYRTPTKTRVVAGGRHSIKQQVVRYDVEDEVSLDDDEARELIARLGTFDDAPRVAVVSDYGYGAAEPRHLATLRRQLGDAVMILGDSRYRLDAFRGLDGASPNLEEAEGLCDERLDDTEALERVGPRLLERLDTRFLLVTRGSSGMTLFEAPGSGSTTGWAHHLPVHGTDQVADVTGAGDTVIGTFALALAAGSNPLEAACLATYAGGLVVMKLGTATISPEELHQALAREPELPTRIVSTSFSTPSSTPAST